MATLLGVEAELATMLQFEKALADAEAALGIIPAAAASAIGRVLDNFRPEIQA
ncbi:MAG: 3-carboxy-cis,cis-muconate cycloisomerase, partial [Mesorhizobium sp.]